MTGPGGAAPDVAAFLWLDETDGADGDLVSERRDADDPIGETGLWVLVLGDLTIFAVLFAVLLAERRSDRAGFARAAGELLTPVGVANTVVLLTSSYLVVLAVGAHRTGTTDRAGRLVLAAAGLGALFVAAKAVEYTVELGGGSGSGLLAADGSFAALYLVITGLHLLHVLVGLTLLGWWRRLARRGVGWARCSRIAGGVAVYWHMVDLLWVVIVALVYLVVRTP